MSTQLPPFNVFFDQHRAMVYRFLMAAVGSAEADDCFQETFLSALRAYPRLTSPEHLDRWILKIASRKAIDAHRSRRRRPVPASDMPDLVEMADRSSIMDAFGSDLQEAVGRLPARQRVAVIHRHLLDLPYREIGDVMGCTEQTARANVYQGMKRLREELSRSAAI